MHGGNVLKPSVGAIAPRERLRVAELDGCCRVSAVVASHVVPGLPERPEEEIERLQQQLSAAEAALAVQPANRLPAAIVARPQMAGCPQPRNPSGLEAKPRPSNFPSDGPLQIYRISPQRTEGWRKRAPGTIW